jgi:hypothetical protein
MRAAFRCNRCSEIAQALEATEKSLRQSATARKRFQHQNIRPRIC